MTRKATKRWRMRVNRAVRAYKVAGNERGPAHVLRAEMMHRVMVDAPCARDWARVWGRRT